MDDEFYRRTIRPLTKPAVALAFDLRATSPLIKRDGRFEMELSTICSGRRGAGGEGTRRDEKGREGKGRGRGRGRVGVGKGREGKGREGKGRDGTG